MLIITLKANCAPSGLRNVKANFKSNTWKFEDKDKTKPQVLMIILLIAPRGAERARKLLSKVPSFFLWYGYIVTY